jgi:hypothetical protein
LQSLRSDGKVILEWILQKQIGVGVGELCTSFIWLRMETVAGFIEHFNGHSDCIKDWEFLDELQDY